MHIYYILVLVSLFSACSTVPSGNERLEYAEALAKRNAFREISLGNLLPLHSYVRHNRTSSRSARLYIEGDGFAYVTRNIPSSDPTPTNPTALHLAVNDETENVIYLSRPCQYTVKKLSKCERRLWTTLRYSQEVIDIFHSAIDDAKSRYDFKKIHLVGFSGGATIGAILAAQRKDIASLRTVAGNLDLSAFVVHHQITSISEGVDPALYAGYLESLPQLHVVGENDSVVPKDIVESFLRQQGISGELHDRRIHVVSGMSHYGLWHTHWPKILKIPLR